MKTLVFVFNIALSIFMFSQSWIEALSKSNASGYYGLKQAFESYYPTKSSFEKSKGWKQFKRWEWFYVHRNYPDFTYISPSALIEAYQKAQQLKIKDGSKSVWVSINPPSVPPTPDTISISGTGRVMCIAFHPTDSNTFFVGTSQGGMWKTTDQGNTWICLTDQLPVLRISGIAIDAHHPDTMYIATGDIDHNIYNIVAPGGASEYGLGVFKTYDGGSTWEPTGLVFQFDQPQATALRTVFVHPDSSNILVAIGLPGIYRSTDYGETWTKVQNGYFVDADMHPQNPNILFVTSMFVPGVVGSKAAIYRSTDFGKTWTELTTPIPPTSDVLRIELAISSADPSKVYALTCRNNGGFYAMYASVDSGFTWSEIAKYSGNNKAPNMLGWADGGYFGITLPGYPPDDAGQGTYDLTLLVHPDSAHIIYTGGINIWGSKNGGNGGSLSTWNIVTFWVNLFGRSIHADQHMLVYNSKLKKYFAGCDGGLYVSDTLILGNLNAIFPCIDFVNQTIIPGCYTLPTQWQDISHGLHNTEYYRIALNQNDPNMFMGGSQDNGTFLFRNGQWLQTYGGDGMEAMIDPVHPSILYATNYNGTLNRSEDGGLTYTTNLEKPITDAGEGGAWVTPFIMHPWYSNIIYTAFYNIWKSEDRGNTWTRLSNLSNGKSFEALTICPSHPEYLYAARVDNVFKTTDGGQTWISIKNGLPMSEAHVTYLAVDFFNPQEIYITFSGFKQGKKVYRSMDGGQTWQNISGNLPNIPVNCIVKHANSPKNDLYIGTDIGVFYTNDSLLQDSSWLYYNDGMPAVVVNELEIHYSSQKIVAATYGRGIWEAPLRSTGGPVPTSISNSKDFTSLNIYPNPAQSYIQVSIPWGFTPQDMWIIYSLDGKKLLEGKVKENTKTIEIQTLLPYGNYLLQILSPKYTLQRQFIISK